MGFFISYHFNKICLILNKGVTFGVSLKEDLKLVEIAIFMKYTIANHFLTN